MWRSNTVSRLLVAGLLSASGVPAQELPLDPQTAVQVNLPDDSPVTLLSAAMGESRATARGAALVIDLHMLLTLRNASPNRIHGVVLSVISQEVALGGKASVSVPSLNVGSGEAFPVRIDLQLMRPTQVAASPLVKVGLDGVLFQNLSFFGPDRLHSQRTLTAWEMEAQRDREHLKRVLAQNGTQGLQQAMLDIHARESERPRLDVRLIRRRTLSGAGVAAAGVRNERFAFLHFPNAPVEPVDGWAELSSRGDVAQAAHIDVHNRSNRAVRYVELGWLVSDQNQQYMAASVPPSSPELLLRPNETARVDQDTELRFSRNGEPVNVRKMAGFVSQVEFTDGKVWVPSRQDLESASLLKVLAPSAEEQRLADIYLKKGLPAVIEELKKF
ncbi:MAG: hypothetical protein JOZ22_07355 [Acidobacteriia bacterium]|nr:hypothetical protein [Terriglobia bacterium]